mmetsp:Transcript_67555/g.187312  ORF Transcript_67555/g.187312 Transcript_67555/m.187312 type:complete len:277 (+) Transcript_67555:611-1441(+)
MVDNSVALLVDCASRVVEHHAAIHCAMHHRATLVVRNAIWAHLDGVPLLGPSHDGPAVLLNVRQHVRILEGPAAVPEPPDERAILLLRGVPDCPSGLERGQAHAHVPRGQLPWRRRARRRRRWPVPQTWVRGGGRRCRCCRLQTQPRPQRRVVGAQLVHRLAQRQGCIAERCGQVEEALPLGCVGARVSREGIALGVLAVGQDLRDVLLNHRQLLLNHPGNHVRNALGHHGFTSAGRHRAQAARGQCGQGQQQRHLGGCRPSRGAPHWLRRPAFSA